MSAEVEGGLRGVCHRSPGGGGVSVVVWDGVWAAGSDAGSSVMTAGREGRGDEEPAS